MLVAGCLAAALGLAGCGDGLDDLRAEIEQAKQRPGGRIAPLPEVKPYESHAYSQAGSRSPFMQSVAASDASGPRPDSKRSREYLEQFPLDTMRMVGTLRLGAANYGLVQTRDGLVHRVLPGNYLGQNDGKILSVAETRISLIEIVPDGLGGYIERPAALGMGE
jgi:type IV pilus assembly protein PilP